MRGVREPSAELLSDYVHELNESLNLAILACRPPTVPCQQVLAVIRE